MVFDKSLDKSLWLILNMDKEHGELVNTFICSIPKLFLKIIQDSVQDYNDFKQADIILNASIYEDYKTLNGFVYWYELFPCGYLDIGCKTKINDEYKDVFAMRIIPIENMEEVMENENVSIGTIEYSIQRGIRGSVTDAIHYDFIKSSVGCGVLWQQKYGAKAGYYKDDVMTSISADLKLPLMKTSKRKLLKIINKNNK